MLCSNIFSDDSASEQSIGFFTRAIGGGSTTNRQLAITDCIPYTKQLIHWIFSVGKKLLIISFYSMLFMDLVANSKHLS